MDLKGKKVIVAGLAKSGIASALFLKKAGALPMATDHSPSEKLGETVQRLKEAGIPMELGGHKTNSFEEADLVILSPGVPHTIPQVEAARKKGIPIWGETELAARHIHEPIVAVTGTNGKTTTTQLLGRMLQHSGIEVFIGGNIGIPLIQYVQEKEKKDIVVAEISSFQLDTISRFRPRVGVLLNITPDHLDRYDGMKEYSLSKARLFMNQTREDKAILNAADPIVRSIARGIRGDKLYFNASSSTDKGAIIQGDKIILNGPAGPAQACIDLLKTSLTGRHNQENIAAAALAALSAGANMEGIKKAMAEVKGLSHRLESIGIVAGVEYFDDSKATNVDAVARALEAVSGPVILIMGGRDKGSDYKILGPAVKGKVKLILVMGEASDKIMDSMKGFCKITKIDSMNNAVAKAGETASPGDCVLLSPACSSFDMFESYAARGEAFTKAVNKLKAEN